MRIGGGPHRIRGLKDGLELVLPGRWGAEPEHAVLPVRTRMGASHSGDQLLGSIVQGCIRQIDEDGQAAEEDVVLPDPPGPEAGRAVPAEEQLAASPSGISVFPDAVGISIHGEVGSEVKGLTRGRSRVEDRHQLTLEGQERVVRREERRPERSVGGNREHLSRAGDGQRRRGREGVVGGSLQRQHTMSSHKPGDIVRQRIPWRPG